MFIALFRARHNKLLISVQYISHRNKTLRSLCVKCLDLAIINQFKPSTIDEVILVLEKGFAY